MPKPKKKKTFEDLKNANLDGDEIYQAQEAKLRERKAERKEKAKELKRGISDAVARSTE